MASALHSMTVIQVFQVKRLESLDDGSVDADVVRDLYAATDFNLMATKRSAQAMGFMVVLHSDFWLTLADLKDAGCKTLLNAPISPFGLFGDAMASVIEVFC